MYPFYTPYIDSENIPHQTALAYIICSLQEIFCPKQPILQDPEIETTPLHIEEDQQPIIIAAAAETTEQEDYLLLHYPQPEATKTTIPAQPSVLQIICNCFATYFRKPKQKE